MAYWNTIATRAQVVLDALASFPTTDVRKVNAVHPRDSIASSLCVISFGDEAPDPGVSTFGDATSQPTVGKIYTLLFSLYLVNLGDIEGDLSGNPDFVLAAKQALNTATLSGATTVWNTELVENAAWEGVKFKDGVELSEFAVRFYSAEARNG
jgi:hypothetical protein